MTQQGFRLNRIRQAILLTGLLGLPVMVQAQTVDIEQRQREQLEQQCCCSNKIDHECALKFDHV